MGRFFYTQRIGRCNTISNGLASAKDDDQFGDTSVQSFVASLAPFLILFQRSALMINRFSIQNPIIQLPMVELFQKYPKLKNHVPS